MKDRKFLVVRLSSLGDIIHAIPAQQHLLRLCPEAEIHWLTESQYQPLLENVDGIHRVWVAGTRSWRNRPLAIVDLPALLWNLRRQKFDAAFDFQGLLKSSLLAWLAGARSVFGFAAGELREPYAARFYTQRVQTGGDARHVIELNLELTSAFGRSNGVSPLIPLRIPEEVEARVSKVLSDYEIHRPILINPGAGWVTKLWPAGEYGRLARAVHERFDAPVILTYGPGEEKLVEEVRFAAGKDTVVTFPTSILELAALCRKARLFVGGDTGPMHLAVALGTPVVSILGPTTPARNGPFCAEDLVVKHNLPCSDCYKRTCDAFICMDISVKTVLEAVQQRLSR